MRPVPVDTPDPVRAGAISDILTDTHDVGTLWFGPAGITAATSDGAPKLRIFFPVVIYFLLVRPVWCLGVR